MKEGREREGGGAMKEGRGRGRGVGSYFLLTHHQKCPLLYLLLGRRGEVVQLNSPHYKETHQLYAGRIKCMLLATSRGILYS